MPICGHTNIIIIINTRGLSQLSPWPLQHRRCLQTRQHAAWMLSSKSQEHWTGLFLDNSSWLSIPAPSPLLHYFGMLKIFPWNNARGMCPMLSNAVRKIQKRHTVPIIFVSIFHFEDWLLQLLTQADWCHHLTPHGHGDTIWIMGKASPRLWTKQQELKSFLGADAYYRAVIEDKSRLINTWW